MGEGGGGISSNSSGSYNNGRKSALREWKAMLMPSLHRDGALKEARAGGRELMLGRKLIQMCIDCANGIVFGFGCVCMCA